MRIYVASSWRNPFHPQAVAMAREAGHRVFDYRNPQDGGPPGARLSGGFHWSEIDPWWESWDPEAYRRAVAHPLAKKVLRQDLAGLEWADVTLMVQPSGRSAHLELGWTIGCPHRLAAVWWPPTVQTEPELMIAGADALLLGDDELREWLSGLPA